MKSFILSCAMVLTLSLGAQRAAYADSATWSMNPTSGDWNTATNWTPNTVPNGPSDMATFGVSNTADVFLSASTEVDGITYNPGASGFTSGRDGLSSECAQAANERIDYVWALPDDSGRTFAVLSSEVVMDYSVQLSPGVCRFPSDHNGVITRFDRYTLR